jgi:hypothetical protein
MGRVSTSSPARDVERRRAGGTVLDAVLERITYANEETGYTIGRVVRFAFFGHEETGAQADGPALAPAADRRAGDGPAKIEVFPSPGGTPVARAAAWTTAPSEDSEQLLQVWAADAALMKSKPGFISAQLHRGVAGSSVVSQYGCLGVRGGFS